MICPFASPFAEDNFIVGKWFMRLACRTHDLAEQILIIYQMKDPVELEVSWWYTYMFRIGRCDWGITGSSTPQVELYKSSWRITSRIAILHFMICFLARCSSFSGFIFSRLFGKLHLISVLFSIYYHTIFYCTNSYVKATGQHKQGNYITASRWNWLTTVVWPVNMILLKQ